MSLLVFSCSKYFSFVRHYLNVWNTDLSSVFATRKRLLSLIKTGSRRIINQTHDSTVSKQLNKLTETISYLFRLGREGFCQDVAMPLLEMKKKLAL